MDVTEKRPKGSGILVVIQVGFHSIHLPVAWFSLNLLLLFIIRPKGFCAAGVLVTRKTQLWEEYPRAHKSWPKVSETEIRTF